MRPHTLFAAFIGVTLGLLCCALMAQPAYAAATIHVKTNGSASGNGNAWNNAVSLQHALSFATGGDEIWVAGGIYIPGINSIDVFTVPAGVALYGGFATTETLRSQRDWIAHPTILSGDIGGDDHSDANGVVTDTGNIVGLNARHLLIVDASSRPITSTTRIDGFTITAAAATGNGIGAGFYCDGEQGICNPHLENLIFSGNLSARGALFNDSEGGGESSPSLVSVAFTGNKATTSGGAIYNDGATGGKSSPSLVNVTFISNTAGTGGAIYNDGTSGESSPNLVNVTFTSNLAIANGGAIFNDGELGGLSSLSLVNATFISNSAAQGGAIFNYGLNGGSSTSSLVNVILWGNSATLHGGQIYFASAGVAITTSLVQGGIGGTGVVSSSGIITDGGGNLNADPRFVDALHNNVRLRSGSPAIDTGTNSAISQSSDLDGNPRKIDGDGNGAAMVDMGAYEFQLFAPLTVTVTGSGSGQIAFTPSGSPCSVPCKGIYLAGSSVILTATAAAGSTFSGWSGACSGAGSPPGTCHLTIDAANAVTATFSENSYPITVHTSGTGSGTVNKQPNQASYLFGSVVLLSAEAAGDSSFSGWGGDCSGHSDCLLTMDRAKEVTASFTRRVTPSFSSTPGLTATVGLLYSYAITATETDDSILTLAAPAKPSWLTLALTGNGTATLSGTPGSANLGANLVQLRVQNEAGDFATQDFTITVAAAPSTPTPTPVTPTPTIGSVQGHVQDEQGKGLAGAQVSLTPTGGAVAASAQSQTTSSSGDYLFKDVAAGHYTLTVTDAGMEPSAPKSVTVHAGQTTTVATITLQVSQPASKPALHLPLLDNNP